MLSRVADSLLWMSRYIERADNTARLLDVNLHILTDFQDLNDSRLVEHWEPIIRSTGDYSLFHELYGVADSYSATDFLTFNRSNPNSILSCLFAARQNARMIRDQISTEMWEAINENYLFLLSSNASDVWKKGPYEFYQSIKDFSHLFQGLTDSTFVHEDGFHFIEIGKYLERGDKTSRILDIKYHILLPRVRDVGGVVDTAQWTAVLRSCSAFEAYHRMFMSNVTADRVTEFLILSESFPRSVRFCSKMIDTELHFLSKTQTGRYTNVAERVSGKLYYDLTFETTADIFSTGLHEYLDYLQVRFNRLGEAIYESYIDLPED